MVSIDGRKSGGRNKTSTTANKAGVFSCQQVFAPKVVDRKWGVVREKKDLSGQLERV